MSTDGSLLRISGHPAVLSSLTTRATEGLSLSAAYPSSSSPEPALALPVSLSSLPSSPMSVTVSHAATGQTVTVPVAPVLSRTCPGDTRGLLAALLYDLAVHYQTVLTVLVACGICIYLSKQMLAGRAAPPSVAAPAKVAAAPPATPAQPEAEKPYLWTVDQSPIYGSPIFR